MIYRELVAVLEKKLIMQKYVQNFDRIATSEIKTTIKISHCH